MGEKQKPTVRRWAGLIAGTAAAIVIPAAIVVAFMFVRPIVLFVIVGLGQGVLTGLALRGVWGMWGPIRNRGAVGALVGLASATAAYGILYLREVVFIAQQSTESTGALVAGLIGLGKSSPYETLDQFMLLPATGHRGLVGYILFRMAEAPQFLNMLVVHVAVTVLLTWRIGVYQRRMARLKPVHT